MNNDASNCLRNKRTLTQRYTSRDNLEFDITDICVSTHGKAMMIKQAHCFCGKKPNLQKMTVQMSNFID